MKFNYFEKIKNGSKKIALGAGVVIASFGNLETQGQEENIHKVKNPDTEEIAHIQNVNIKNNSQESRKIADQKKIDELKKELGISSVDEFDPEFYRNEYIKYMEHPSYKQRLTKEMFGDEIIDEQKQKMVDGEYNERIKQIKKIPIRMLFPENEGLSKYCPINDNIETKASVIFHELSHSLDYRKGNTIEDHGFEVKKNDIFSNKNPSGLELELDELYKKRNSLEKIDPEKNRQEFIKMFKKNIDIDKNNIEDLFASLEPYKKEISKLKNYLDYLRANTEVKARLNYLRMKAIENYNFDLNKDFNINDFEKLKEDSQYNDLKNNLGLSDEQINELMKYTAMNEKGDDTYYHSDWDYKNKGDQA